MSVKAFEGKKEVGGGAKKKERRGASGIFGLGKWGSFKDIVGQGNK